MPTAPAVVAPKLGGASTARPTLRLGSQGEDVSSLQGSLERLGYDLGSRGVDGKFGPATKRAVQAFQEANHLDPDGVVGPLTWGALERQRAVDAKLQGWHLADTGPAEEAHGHTAPSGPGAAPGTGRGGASTARPTLRLGSQGEDVSSLQGSLERLGYDLGSRGVDGKFGPATKRAVQAFQEANHLDPDGVVGPLTWGALERQRAVDAKLQGWGLAETGRAARPTRSGDRNDHVKDLQRTNVFEIVNNTGTARQLTRFEVQSAHLGADQEKKLKTGNYFILQGRSLVPTSQATIEKINDPSKCAKLVGFAVRKLQSDAVSFNGKFPEGYYATFAKAIFEEAISYAPGDPGHGVDLAGKTFGYKVGKVPDVLPAYHIFESVARIDEDNGFDKVQHFTRSAYLQYKYGSATTDISQYGKEIFRDEIPSWFPWSSDKGFDKKDMLANNLGQAYGDKLYAKYHPTWAFWNKQPATP